MPVIQVTKAASLTGHTGSVYTLVRHPGKPEILLSGSGDGRVIRWDLSKLSEAAIVAQVQSNIFSLLMLEGGRLLIGQMQGGIHVLDLHQRKEIRHLALHRQGVFDLQSDRGDRILAAGGDGMLSVWNAEYSLLNSIAVSSKSIRQIAFHPLKPLMALGCSDHAARIIDRNDFKEHYRLTDHRSSVFSVCFSPDGKYLLTGSRDAHLRVWDAEDGFQLKLSIPAHLFTINSIAYRPSGKYFATASRDKTIKIWNAENFELLKVIDRIKSDGHVNSVNKLIWADYDDFLVSCSDDRSVMVWKVEGN